MAAEGNLVLEQPRRSRTRGRKFVVDYRSVRRIEGQWSAPRVWLVLKRRAPWNGVSAFECLCPSLLKFNPTSAGKVSSWSVPTLHILQSRSALQFHTLWRIFSWSSGCLNVANTLFLVENAQKCLCECYSHDLPSINHKTSERKYCAPVYTPLHESRAILDEASTQFNSSVLKSARLVNSRAIYRCQPPMYHFHSMGREVLKHIEASWSVDMALLEGYFGVAH